MYNLDKLEEAEERRLEYNRKKLINMCEVDVYDKVDFNFEDDGFSLSADTFAYYPVIEILRSWEKMKIKVENFLDLNLEGKFMRFNNSVSFLNFSIARLGGEEASSLEAWLYCKLNFEMNIFKYLKFFGKLTVDDQEKYNELTAWHEYFLRIRPKKLKKIEERELPDKKEEIDLCKRILKLQMILKEEIDLYKRILKLQMILEENKFIVNCFRD